MRDEFTDAKRIRLSKAVVKDEDTEMEAKLTARARPANSVEVANVVFGKSLDDRPDPKTVPEGTIFIIYHE
jgi:hypothetical protein